MEHGVITTPPWHALVITGENSSWSNTQTLTISTSDSTATPGTTSTPNPNTTSSPTTTQNTALPTEQPGAQTGVLFGLDWEKTATIILASWS